MRLKIKNFNIIGAHQFLGEGVTKEYICIHKQGELPKRGAWTICRGLGKKEGGGCF